MRTRIAMLAGLLLAVTMALPSSLGQAPNAAGSHPAAREGASSGGVQTVRNVEYAKVGRKSLLLDLYVPRKTSKPLPLVVWIHGGGWVGGDKNGCPAAPLAARGYVVASINYRLSQEAIFPAQIEDCKGAIRFLRANAAKYSIDPERIGVWGSSAGGHRVALLGTSGGVAELEGTVGGNLDQSSKVQAVADFCGPADFALFLRNITRGAAGPLRGLLGGEPGDESVKALGVKASPVTYVKKGAPPFLIVHGDRDNTVPVGQSVSLTKALKAAGDDVTLRIIRGAGHGVMNPATARLAGDFFDKHLRAKPTSNPTPPATSRPAETK